MKLNSLQIERLYQFTRQHYVEWYDLQTELVDHLANAIEKQWQQNPKLSFEDALQIEFKKFGVFGFMDVVEKRQKALGKKYNKIIWSHFKEFFTVPKIVITFSLIIGLFYTLKFILFYELITIGLTLAFIALLITMIYAYKKRKERKQKTGKVWLFEEMISGYGSFNVVFTLPIHLFNSITNFDKTIPNDYFLFGFSFFVVVLFLFSYIVIKIIPSKAEQYLKETYPEYDLANTL